MIFFYSSPPLPELLRDISSKRVTTGCYLKEPSLQIAPDVFLYWDVWPHRILPNESYEALIFDSFDAILHSHQESNDETDQSESIGYTGQPLNTKHDKTENKEKTQVLVEEHLTPLNKENEEQESLFFGITLCVGDQIYTSVTGVSQKMLHYIVKHWLSFTPYEKDLLHKYQLVQQQAYPSFLSSSYF